MVAIVKDVNGKAKNSQVAQQKNANKESKRTSKDSSDSDEDSSESEEEIKISLKKKPTVASAVVVAGKKEPVKMESEESDDDDDEEETEEESEEETKAKPAAKKAPVKQETESEEEEEEKLIIHPKNGVNNKNNGFNKPGANSKEDEAINNKLKDIATDVKSSEAAEKGDFKNFDLSKNMIEKLKGNLL